MKTTLIAALALGLLGATVSADTVTFKGEEAAHPNIVAAIRAMNAAITDMDKAPDNFGGNKAKAISDTKAARTSLVVALFFRLKADEAAFKKACAGELKGDAICY